MVERDGILVLQFYSGSRLVVELFAQPDGSWRGGSLGDSGFEARLDPRRKRGAAGRMRMPSAFTGRPRRKLRRCSIRLCLRAASIRRPSASCRPRSRCSTGCSTTSPSSCRKACSPGTLAQTWRAALEALAQSLKETRDARLSRMPQDLVAPVGDQSAALLANLLAERHGGHSKTTDVQPLCSSRPLCRATAATGSPCGPGFFLMPTPSASPSTWPSSLSRAGGTELTPFVELTRSARDRVAGCRGRHPFYADQQHSRPQARLAAFRQYAPSLDHRQAECRDRTRAAGFRR